MKPRLWCWNELSHDFQIHAALMDHWRLTIAAGRLMEFRHEDLVNDTASQVRRLLELRELPWDESCLGFHETDRRVTCPSHAPVRPLLYTSEIGPVTFLLTL